MGAPLEFISLIAALTGFAHLSKPSTWHREEDREIVLECLLRVHLRAEGNLLGQGHSGQWRETGQSVGTLVKIPVVFESERTLCQEETSWPSPSLQHSSNG